MTVQEAAKVLKMDAKNVRRLLRSGALKGKKVEGEGWVVDAGSAKTYKPKEKVAKAPKGEKKAGKAAKATKASRAKPKDIEEDDETIDDEDDLIDEEE